jgi:predicted nucleic acid-binding protein
VNELVLDSSITLSWCLSDENSEYAEAVLQALRHQTARVPCLWPFEVANGLWVNERRGRITVAEIQRAIADLAALSISVDTASHGRAPREILALARQEGLTVYDVTNPFSRAFL